MTVGIYKITHIPSGRFYVGQSVNIEKRWQHHCIKASQCVHLRNAIQKYGREQFSFEVLEEVNSSTLLNEREQYYLNTLDPFGDRGFNICKIASTGPTIKGVPKTGKAAAGANNHHNCPVTAYDQNGNIVGNFYSVRHATHVLGIDKSGIHACLSGRYRTAGGLFWTRQGETPIIRERKTRKGYKDTPERIEQKRINAKIQHANKTTPHTPNTKAVQAKDDSGAIVHTFEQVTLAAQHFSVSRAAIGKAASTGRRSCGLYWSYIGNL